MFFILSKLLLFLLSPWNWLLMLGVCWIAAPRFFPVQRRRIGLAMVLIAFVFSNPFLHKMVILGWQPDVKTQQHSKSFHTGILLTGITMGNSAGHRFFGAGSGDRFLQTVKLYHSGVIQHVLVNGGNASIRSTRKPEAFFIADELKQCGIPASAITVESESRNTFESAANAVGMLRQKNAIHQCLLITSAMHMRRALRVYQHAGIKAEPHVADYEAIEAGFSPGDLLPDAALLTRWQFTLKEIVGYAAYRLTGKL